MYTHDSLSSDAPIQQRNAPCPYWLFPNVARLKTGLFFNFSIAYFVLNLCQSASTVLFELEKRLQNKRLYLGLTFIGKGIFDSLYILNLRVLNP